MEDEDNDNISEIQNHTKYRIVSSKENKEKVQKVISDLNIDPDNFPWLENGEYLNDQAMDFYIEALKIAYQKELEKEDNVSIFGTYWYTQYKTKNTVKEVVKMINKNKTKLDKQLLIFPINIINDDWKHWVTWWIFRENGEKNGAFNKFLYMDSLNSCISEEDRMEIFNHLQLVADSARMKFLEIEVPQQKNDHDWGLWVLRSIEALIKWKYEDISEIVTNNVFNYPFKNQITRADLKELITS